MIRSLKGKTPKIHPTAFISEAAYLVGDIEIGANSSVWPGVVIRADHGRIAIGERTNIQDGSVLHCDVDMHIGDDVTIGPSVMCHATHVDDHSFLGRGCTLNEGARVGAWSMVAPDAVLIENREVPDESIAAGVPAKVTGRMTQEDIDLVQQTAEAYVRMAAEYKAEGNLE